MALEWGSIHVTNRNKCISCRDYNQYLYGFRDCDLNDTAIPESFGFGDDITSSRIANLYD